MTATCILSISRIRAQWSYYHSPLTVAFVFETQEIPRLLNTTGHIYLPPPKPVSEYNRHDEEQPRIDMSLIKPFDLRLCVGKEWHRFPGHYLVPEGVRVDWIKSDFDGMLPGHFLEAPKEGGLLERIKGTSVVPSGLNDLNKEAPEFYVGLTADPVSDGLLTCVYLFSGRCVVLRLSHRSGLPAPSQLFTSRASLRR